MIVCGRWVVVLAGAMISFACAGQTTEQISEATCEEVLASFSVIPTTQQNDGDRRRMLQTIRTMQEADFAEPCARYAHWQSRFESAYRRAL